MARDLFGINSYQWSSSGNSVKLHQGDKAYKHHQAAQKNPEKYTTTRPNGGSKAAFTLDDWASEDSDSTTFDEKISFYEVPQAKPAPAPAPAPAATPKPKAAPVPKPKAPVAHSPEIQQAKDRVNSYEKDILSGKTSEDIYGQAQATVQSSFIKPTSSNPTEQIDFSADTFEAKESSVPNEQAQAAQTQMQNYISKYSQYKSSS
jgi:hypothetical protein